MPIKVLMPALSPTMEKGNLAKWLKKEGDKIKSGDILAEIETDKATMEVEAVDEGVLAKILVAAGSQDVPVNTEIALIAAEGESVSNISSAPSSATSAPAPKATAPQTTPASPLVTTATAQSQTHGAKTFASPLAKRIAKEAGIDFSKIAGSGPHGRIIERDVKAALAGGTAPRAITASAPSAAPQLATGMADAVVKQLFEAGSYEEVPHDSMRKTIARRLLESKQTVPHFYVTADIELDALLKAREEINANAPKGADGKPVYKLSVNDFVIKALAVALMRVPEANVTWTEHAMLKHKHADVGVAVSIPGGLITPVIRKADLKSLSAISNEMKDLAVRARARKLKPEEYQGGTTAVSNLGMFGVKQFAAIVNPPHATILAVGAGEQRPVVKNGQLTVATVMTVTFSTDHRAVDGALGAELLAALKGLIENPVSMLV
ncbi:MAG: pyruvate dehydrogenase complex dihydrolipoamide acetyltransferase [Hyphomicrobiales bacterium]|nr:pyruvate dehydrogenase complex dihydrolipoamide acetyltransferase [Hyphomicrobiales bacterium]